MKHIPLTKGKFAIVDDQDLYRLQIYKWYFSNKGYACRSDYSHGKKKTVFMHSMIIQCNDDHQPDHKNLNKLDNTRRNLRIATRTQNQGNKAKKSGCSSRFKGVSWDKKLNKWRARIKQGSKLIYLGNFISEIDAAYSYDLAAKKYFEEFANLNFKESLSLI